MDRNVDVAFKFSNAIKKRLMQNSNKDISSEKDVYILPCLDCNNKYVGETGRGLSIRMEEDKRACTMGMENSAVTNH